MKNKKMRGMMCAAVLLLALAAPSSAVGQFDSFFYIDDSEYRSGGEGTSGEATLADFEDGKPLPTGGGLLVLALSGACYAVAKRRESRKLKD